LRAGKTTTALALAVVLLLGGSRASAHRLDEYLQAARLKIDPAHVEFQLDLTPGVAVADSVIADIDRDRDGVLSADERHAYVEQVMRAISLDVDGLPLRVRSVGSTFPDVQAFRRGEGTIELRGDVSLPPLAEGAHQLSYRNANRPDVSVYLANALVPESDRVAVHVQRRDTDQRELTIDYELRPQPSASPDAWLWLGLACSLALAALAGLRAQRLTAFP